MHRRCDVPALKARRQLSAWISHDAYVYLAMIAAESEKSRSAIVEEALALHKELHERMKARNGR